MRCSARAGSVATTAHAKFGRNDTTTVLNDTAGAPRRCVIQMATGYVAAEILAAARICRGEAGRTIAPMRMTTVFQERPTPPLNDVNPLHVFRRATAAAFNTK